MKQYSIIEEADYTGTQEKQTWWKPNGIKWTTFNECSLYDLFAVK